MLCFALQKGTTGHQSRDRYRKRKSVDTGILFPAILIRRGAIASNKCQRPCDHVARFDTRESATIPQSGREEDRESRLVQLDATPVGLPAQPLILIPVAVHILGRDEIPKCVPSFGFSA